ncbi:MAG: hypothetical protein H0V89_02740 [Deltaproteobacteria bacterium]|nr:hypothetical protein [Deltaproteobacteria bacterium]
MLRPPVKAPTALVWIPGREELLVATREGLLLTVDPVLGTRTLAENLGETAVLSAHEDRSRILVVTRQGRWKVLGARGETLNEGRHDFLGSMEGFFADPYLLLFGDEEKGRFLYLIEGDQLKHRVPLPPRVIAALSENGKGLLCRSTEQGLQVVLFGKEKLPKDEPTLHRLRPAGRFVLGFTGTGIAVWTHAGGMPRSMRLPDITAGDISRDGTWLALGMRNGAVALSRIDRLDKRIHPDLVRAFNGPVTCVAFSSKGRWLATGAEGLRIWSWED